MARLIRPMGLVKIAVFVPTFLYLAGYILLKNKRVFDEIFEADHMQLWSFVYFFLAIFFDAQIVMKGYE